MTAEEEKEAGLRTEDGKDRIPGDCWNIAMGGCVPDGVPSRYSTCMYL